MVIDWTVVWHNVAWFGIVWCAAYLFGILAAFRKKVAFIVMMVGAFLLLFLVVYCLMTGIKGDHQPWYYYIGSVLSGMFAGWAYSIGKSDFNKYWKGI